MSLLEKIQQLRKTLYDKCDRLEVAERIHWENGYNQALEDVEKLLSEVATKFPKDAGFGFNEDGTKIYSVYDWFDEAFAGLVAVAETGEKKGE